MIRLPEGAPADSATARRIAILGCGNVGAEVARQLQRRHGLQIVSVLVRREDLERPVPRAVLTGSMDAVLASRPEVIVELLGGVEPARSHIEAALRRGIHVVTANKSVIARHGRALNAIARRHGALLRYESSVGAGVPVIAALDQLRGDRIVAIRGIVNGTCNFILERMEKTRCTLSEALAEAQRLGFAEPDPTADISGRDSAEKLCVLAQVAGWGWIDPAAVRTCGVESVAAEDVRFAGQRNCVIRLVAEAECDAQGRVSLRVGPTLVPRSHPLATPTGCENAFEIEAELAGTIRLHGPGAGAKPTASAVLCDLLGTLDQPETMRRSIAPTWNAPGGSRRYYIRASQHRGARSPADVHGELGRLGIETDLIELHLDRTTIETLPSRFEAVTDLIGSWKGGAGVQVLVAPIVDQVQRPIPESTRS